MKNLYFKSINYKPQYLVILFALLFGNVFTAEAQVKKAYTQRTSTYTPTKKIYNIQGDFTMLGNTNLTPQNYTNTVNNNSSQMMYVDIDGDPNTWNSSSSTLALSTENGALPSCSNIIYAGLYWTGKSSASNTFTATKQIQNGTQTINNNLTVSHNDNIANTNYSLSISRNNPSNNNRSPIYTFTNGINTYVFNFYNSTATNRVTLSINNATAINIPVTVNAGNTDATLTTPYVIIDGAVTLTINKLIRDAATNLTTGNTQSTSKALVNVSGTVPAFTTLTKNFDKRKISLKGPGESSYTSFTANINDIYYPSGTDDDIYSAYAEVTDYVKLHGIGAYFAADIALLEGNPGGTGYSGGWGMIVIYENSKMKYRDVTIFDGYAYVQASNTSGYTLPVSGFNTVQTGNVGMKIGLMASEGDVNFTGDYFQIQKVSDASYMNLSHSGNSETNFFNSSIIVGGARNPNLQNNTGVDFSMFTIPNVGNSVITHNQSSVNFKFGTSGDTYSIFAIAMAVDAYTPVAEAMLAGSSLNGVPVIGSMTSVVPGDEIGIKTNIFNKGTEAINNTKLVIAIPYMVDFVPGSLTKNVNFSPLPSPNNYYFDPSLGPKGSIVFDLGTLPMPANPDTILADFSFKVKVTTDCSILSNSACSQFVSISGNVGGTGATTGINFTNKPFYVGYEQTGNCTGEPILNPLNISVNATSYVNQNCQNTTPIRDFVFCNPDSTIPITDINTGFPPGSRFFNQDGTIEYTISNPFPATSGSVAYYALPPGASVECNIPFTITVTNVITTPVTVANIEYCKDAIAMPLTATATAHTPPYTLYYYTSETGTPQLSITPPTATIGSTTYWVAEAASGTCIGPKVPIVVTVNSLPMPSLVNKTNVSCYGTSTGSIDITVTGGIAPYTYVWTKDGNPYNAVTEDLTNIESGVYVVSVSDSKSCKCIQLSVTITQPEAAITLTATPSQIVCFGGTGSVVLSSNGVAPFTYGGDATTNLVAGTYNYTVTDANGCTATTSVTLIDGDSTPPVINELPSNSTINCPATPAFTQATAFDNSEGIVTLNFKDIKTDGVCAGSYSVTRTWTATDACGNTSTASQTINIIDTIAPVIAVPPTRLSINCQETPVFGEATATDECGSLFTLTSADVTTPGECAGSYSITRTWTAKDDCGNTSTAYQTIRVKDETSPIIVACAPDQIIATNLSCQAIVPDFTKNIVANDNCSSMESLIVTQSPAAGTVAQSGTTTITLTVKDACGNKSTCETKLIVTNFIVANDDTGSSINGLTGGISFTNVLSNDLLNCKALIPEDVTTTFVSSTNPGITLNGTNVVVAPGTPAGNYTLIYQICEIANPTNCDAATVTITVTAPAIIAQDDTIAGGNGTIGNTNAGNVLNNNGNGNDTLNGVNLTIDEVNLTVTTPATPIGGAPIPIVDIATGQISIPTGTPAGTYTIVYSICDKLNPTNCDAATVTITVTAPAIIAQDDTIAGGNGTVGNTNAGNVLNNNGNGNDTLNGVNLTVDQVNLTVTTPATPIGGAPVPVVDTATGQISIPAGTPAGTYTIVYSICDKLNPTNCDAATVAITVSAEAIVAQDDKFIDIDGANGNPNAGNVLNNNGNGNDTLNGANVTIDLVNLTITIPAVSIGGPVPVIDTTTGQVSVPAGTPAGTYTIVYQICEKLNPTNCDAATVIIEVGGVLGENCDAIVVHKVLTPNFDDKNDILIIDGVEDIACYPSGVNVEIYNRWGVLVFETAKYSNTSNYFDGYSKGRTTVSKSDGLPTGTYFYILNYETLDGNGNSIINKKDGFIYLSR